MPEPPVGCGGMPGRAAKISGTTNAEMTSATRTNANSLRTLSPLDCGYGRDPTANLSRGKRYLGDPNVRQLEPCVVAHVKTSFS